MSVKVPFFQSKLRSVLVLLRMSQFYRQELGPSVTKQLINKIPQRCVQNQNQLTVMCTTRGEHSLISIRCQKKCVESKFAIPCRMIPNLVIIDHAVQEL